MLFMTTMRIVDAIAFCVSGFVTGVIVSFFAIHREMRTTILASIVLTIWYVIELGSVLFRVGLSGGNLAYSLLELAVDMMCLSVFTITGAWLIRRRRLQQSLRSD